jgi:hypothetical protein
LLRIIGSYAHERAVLASRAKLWKTLDLGFSISSAACCRHAGGHERNGIGIGWCTNASTRNVLFALSSACGSYSDSVRGRKGQNGKASMRGCVKRPTYNMPEKHQQFARPNNPENMIGTVSKKRQHDDEEPFPSFLPAAAAALITNT